MPETQYKCVINQKTYHFTRTELEARYKRYNLTGTVLKATIDNLIERLKKFDGDPYGYLRESHPEIWKSYHRQEEKGICPRIYQRDTSLDSLFLKEE